MARKDIRSLATFRNSFNRLPSEFMQPDQCQKIYFRGQYLPTHPLKGTQCISVISPP